MKWNRAFLKRDKKEFAIVLFTFCIVLFSSCGNNSTQKETSIDTTSATIIDSSSTQTKTLPTESDTSQKTEWLLVPGLSAGNTKINENADSVYQRLGTPDGGDAAMQKAVAIWWAHHDTTSYSMAIYTARNTDSGAVARVLQIRVTSPTFKTKEGIHTTSNLADIKKVFPVEQTETYNDAGKKYSVYDSAEGIVFEMNSDDVCVAIIIHKKGVTHESTYLKFRTTNKFINRR